MDERIRKLLTNGAIILELEGPLRMGPHLNHFVTQAQAALEQNPRALILDFTLVGNIDTAAIGEMIQLNSKAAARKSRLLLAGLSPRLRHLLEIMRLDAVLTCCEDRNGALALLDKAS
jgi:anti-anti-sigma regulatory factor